MIPLMSMSEHVFREGEFRGMCLCVFFPNAWLFSKSLRALLSFMGFKMSEQGPQGGRGD